MELLMINPGHWARTFFESIGLSDNLVSGLTISVDFIILIVASLIADFIARKILMGLIKRWVIKSKVNWDNYFLEGKVFQALVHLLPTMAIFAFIPIVFEDIPKWISPMQTSLSTFFVYQISILINRTSKAASHILENTESFKDKPIRTLLSVVQFLTWFIAILAVVSIWTGTPLFTLLGAMAGATAIVILIFQDAINGLLANFQITLFDLLRKGDWVTFEKFGVDGDVLSVDLTTVKIKNFDNTISSVPAKAFVTDSFINWRGIEIAQVRRIKRNLTIDIDTIKFCDSNLLDQLRSIEGIREYIIEQGNEIEEHNVLIDANKSNPVNGRNLTNLGIFRVYATNYLQNHERLSSNHSLMVRQLQPLNIGIPLEIYCFAKEINWVPYEGIVSDIFDHLIAAAPAFGLKIYQAPTSRSGYIPNPDK
ncbi:MAG: Miniconductance mechanosensitive channel YbdG [Owenweeksia sp. TMED14]|nr:MAG: Miniconductance mechanosensitive channel YbdG [Owenweeksia sp. TMED14]